MLVENRMVDELIFRLIVDGPGVGRVHGRNPDLETDEKVLFSNRTLNADGLSLQGKTGEQQHRYDQKLDGLFHCK